MVKGKHVMMAEDKSGTDELLAPLDENIRLRQHLQALVANGDGPEIAAARDMLRLPSAAVEANLVVVTLAKLVRDHLYHLPEDVQGFARHLLDDVRSIYGDPPHSRICSAKSGIELGVYDEHDWASLRDWKGLLTLSIRVVKLETGRTIKSFNFDISGDAIRFIKSLHDPDGKWVQDAEKHIDRVGRFYGEAGGLSDKWIKDERHNLEQRLISLKNYHQYDNSEIQYLARERKFLIFDRGGHKMTERVIDEEDAAAFVRLMANYDLARSANAAWSKLKARLEEEHERETSNG